MLKISWINIIISLLIFTLTLLLVFEVYRNDKEVIVEIVIENQTIQLYDIDKQKIDLIEIAYLNPNQKVTYYLEMKHYNVEELLYRFVVKTTDENFFKYITITFNNEKLEEEDELSTNWGNECINSSEMFEITFHINQNIYEHDSEMKYLFDISLESKK